MIPPALRGPASALMLLVALAPVSASTGPMGPVRFPPARGFLDEQPGGLVLVGAAVRMREGIPFYSLGYYINLSELLPLAGPGPHNLAQLARILMEGRVQQAFITRFHQPVSRERRRAFLLTNLKRWWPEPEFNEAAPTVRQFVAFFDEPLARGEETEVWIRKGVAFTRKPGKPFHRTSDRSICRAFLASYLSGETMEGAEQPLQQDLLRDLPDLLRKRSSPNR